MSHHSSPNAQSRRPPPPPALPKIKNSSPSPGGNNDQEKVDIRAVKLRKAGLTFVKMPDQTLCVDIDGKCYEWIPDFPNKREPGKIGAEYFPKRDSVLMGSTHAALDEKLYLAWQPSSNSATETSYKVYVGSQDAAVNQKGLNDALVRTIINLATGIKVQRFDKMNYIDLPVLDVPESDLSKIFKESFKAIDQALLIGSVLIHCNQGVSRSASICIAYLMYKDKLTFPKAYHALKLSKPDIKPNEGFVRQLKDLQAKLY